MEPRLPVLQGHRPPLDLARVHSARQEGTVSHNPPHQLYAPTVNGLPLVQLPYRLARRPFALPGQSASPESCLNVVQDRTPPLDLLAVPPVPQDPPVVLVLELRLYVQPGSILMLALAPASLVPSHTIAPMVLELSAPVDRTLHPLVNPPA